MNAERRAAVLMAALLAASCGGSGDASGERQAATSAQGAPAGDPMTDAAAWKALAAEDRRTLTADVVLRTDYASAASARKSYEFLKERAEDAAASDIVTRRLAAARDCAWAHGVRGETDIAKVAAECFKKYELADADDVAPVVALRKLAGDGSGPTWADAATAKKAEELVAEIAKEDARLSNPYQAAVAKWVQWQHGYRVMRDLPEVHEAAGRYLVFVSTGGDKVARRSKAAEDKARIVLGRYVGCVKELETAWARDVAGPLHLPAYDGETADERAFLKVNVFTESDDYYEYQFDVDSWDVEASWAHYVDSEPRFLATLLPRAESQWAPAKTSFLTEGVRQLVHFHTWEATKRARGRELDYAQCLHRPHWSALGFPRFFAHHASTPSAPRPWIGDAYVALAVATKKQWKPWSVAEMLSIRDRADLSAAARKRGGGGAAGEAAVGVLSELFQARAASLADFLWNAEAGGKPKHRERYLAWLGSEMVVKTRVDPNGQDVAVRPSLDDFKRAFGLASDAALAEFGKEWDAYEQGIAEREKSATWDSRIASWLAQIDAPPKK